jgi:hypothetical protein
MLVGLAMQNKTLLQPTKYAVPVITNIAVLFLVSNKLTIEV